MELNEKKIVAVVNQTWLEMSIFLDLIKNESFFKDMIEYWIYDENSMYPSLLSNLLSHETSRPQSAFKGAEYSFVPSFLEDYGLY